MRTTIALSLVLASAFLLGCSEGGTTPLDLKRDKGRRDLRVPDRSFADQEVSDITPWPDKPKPDKGPKLEAGLCGNKKVDTGEKCDKAILAGSPGACPTSAADCDDKNKCTIDSMTGSAATCTAVCDHSPIASCCGNGTVDTGEECDDGNVVDNDGCNNLCKLPGGHLVITEVAVSPSEAEFVEIYNPSTQPVALDNVYISDRYDYFMLPTGTLASGPNDFVARFPKGTKIDPGKYLVIAVQGSLGYKTTYGKAPDFELKNSELSVTDLEAPLTNAIGSQASLTDGGELVVLFTWDGATDLIKDLDYVVWKGASASMVSKNSTVCLDGPDTDTTTTCYLDDTAVTAQAFLPPPTQGGSLHRCNHLEGTEKKTGGNGAAGHDETSEPFDGAGATWKRNPSDLTYRTPGLPAPVGFCPQ